MGQTSIRRRAICGQTMYSHENPVCTLPSCLANATFKVMKDCTSGNWWTSIDFLCFVSHFPCPPFHLPCLFPACLVSIFCHKDPPPVSVFVVLYKGATFPTRKTPSSGLYVDVDHSPSCAPSCHIESDDASPKLAGKGAIRITISFQHLQGKKLLRHNG